MYQRPKSSETDEDLLRMQEDFIKNEKKIHLAAKVISEYSKEQGSSRNSTNESVSIQEQIANTFEDVPRCDAVGSIIENTSLLNTPNLSQVRFNASRGFPQARRRNAGNDSSIKKSGSIFSQQCKRPKREISEEAMEVDSSTCTVAGNAFQSSSQLPTQSYLLAGSESARIHEENLNKLRTMTAQEIAEEREKLIETMDPALISFLKSRRKNALEPNKIPSIKEQNKVAQTVDISELDGLNEILNKPEAEKWLNFGSVEINKLAWMKDVDIPKKIEQSDSYEARFDFDGWLMPFTQPEITEKTRILYHHGEEPGRPGYTLQELFQLARSNINQQKIVALNSIANILSLNSSGIYDDIIDLPIEQIFFVLRHCLDDNTPSILNASIKAMRNLFYSKIDETCLDALLGFCLGQIQPILSVDDCTNDDDTENDQQLAEKNLIRCLARTEILSRIRYIINTVKPTIETIIYSMDILTRLARDSRFVMTKVYKSGDLIDSIFLNFVPATSVASTQQSAYGLPLLQSLKFLRVLASRSRQISVDFVDKYLLMKCLSAYLSSEDYAANVNGLRLQTESLNLWCTLVHYNLTLDWFANLTPVLMNILDYHLKNTNIHEDTTFVRQGHLGAVFKLIGIVSGKQCSLVHPFLELIRCSCVKFMRQFMTASRFSCGKLQIISSVFFSMSCLWKSGVFPCTVTQPLELLIIELLKSESFKIVTNSITNGSMLLNNYETHKTSSNLKSLEAAAWNTSEHIIPVLQNNSCLPLINALSNFIAICHNKEAKLTFLIQENIKKYIELLAKSERFHLTNNWFTRIENRLVMNVLMVSIGLKSDLDASIYYKLAVRSLSIFNHDQKEEILFILNRIVFSVDFYPSEALLQTLTIGETRIESLEMSLENLGEISTVYTKILGLDKDTINYTTSLSLDLALGNVIPIDWIYTPIIVLYSNQQQENKKISSESELVFTIRNCLRWILIYETYFPDLAASINATDRFCRIVCLFLGNDSLFLIDEIHYLLELSLRNVIAKFEGKIDFNRTIQGLASFQDLYTELLEQYQSVSYGDVLFGNFILVPLAQRHNIKFRKTLWSEYMGVVETFNVTVKQSICPFEVFADPPEEDLSLLQCYRRALVNKSIRKHSILYRIAKHHVDQFVARKKVNK